MGGSGNWLKSLVTNKKTNSLDHEKLGGRKGKKWKLWRISSASDNGLSVKSGQVSEASDLASVAEDFYSAAMATLIRAPPRDFFIVRQEWAAVRIQTAFRAFLARRAFRALKALVRLQAIVRGRLVRKKAAMTLKCMQALVRAQAHVRAHRVRASLEDQSNQKLLEKHQNQNDPVKQAEEGWCDIRGSVEEVRTKLQMRQEGVSKRERALAYALSQQQIRSSLNLNSRNKDVRSSFLSNIDKNNTAAWTWLDRWMASKPWENRIMEEANSDLLDTHSPVSNHKPKTLEQQIKTRTKAKNSKPNSNSNSDSFIDDEPAERFTTTRNKATRRVFARPPSSSPSPFVTAGQASLSNSDLSLKLLKDESLTTSTSTRTPLSVEGGTDESDGMSKPRYMNFTASNRAKLRGTSVGGGASRKPHSHRGGAHHQLHGGKSMVCKSGEGLGGGRISVDLAAAHCLIPHSSEDLYPPTSSSSVDRYDWSR